MQNHTGATVSPGKFPTFGIFRIHDIAVVKQSASFWPTPLTGSQRHKITVFWADIYIGCMFFFVCENGPCEILHYWMFASFLSWQIYWPGWLKKKWSQHTHTAVPNIISGDFLTHTKNLCAVTQLLPHSTCFTEGEIKGISQCSHVLMFMSPHIMIRYWLWRYDLSNPTCWMPNLFVIYFRKLHKNPLKKKALPLVKMTVRQEAKNKNLNSSMNKGSHRYYISAYFSYLIESHLQFNFNS